MKGATYEEAEAAKEILAAELADLTELRGIGIAVLDVGYGVRVNLSGPTTRIVPTEIHDVPVIVKIVDTIRPQ
jgi:hypothetical protein